MSYGSPVELKRERGLVRQQSGWSFFDAESGAPLLRAYAWAGQLWLVSVEGEPRARASFLLSRRTIDNQQSQGFAFLTEVELDNGMLKMCATDSSISAPQFNLELPLVDVVKAAREGKEWVCAQTVRGSGTYRPSPPTAAPWRRSEYSTGSMPVLDEGPAHTTPTPTTVESGENDGPIW